MCSKWEAYIGQAVGYNIVEFKSKMNQHISNSRTVTVSASKFLIHVC